MTSREELIGKYVAIQCIEGATYTGKVEQYDDHLVLSESYIIIEWGTERGFGQLCLTGKTPETILGAAGTSYINTRSIIAIFPCSKPLC